MPYDDGLADRLRTVYATIPNVEERRMFGGLAFLVAGNMSCGIVGETLMVRVGPDAYEEALSRPHARKMDFTGRAMKGFVFVDPAGFDSDEELAAWVAWSVAFATSLPPK